MTAFSFQSSPWTRISVALMIILLTAPGCSLIRRERNEGSKELAVVPLGPEGSAEKYDPNPRSEKKAPKSTIDQLRAEIIQQRETIRDLETKLSGQESAPMVAAGDGVVESDENVDWGVVKEIPSGPLSEQEYAANLTRASTLIDSGRYDDAVLILSALTKIKTSFPLASRSLYLLGEAHLRQGERQLAKNSFEKLLEDFPLSGRSSEALAGLALLAEQEGNKKVSSQFQEILLNTFPHSPSSIRLMMGKR